jgi:5-methyltetrahydrofolate--homocysteine methyltransferase
MNVTPCSFDDWTSEHWQTIRAESNAWWAGELDRPLVHMVINRKATTPMPAPKPFGRGLFSDLSISEELIVEQLAWEFSQKSFLGDAFPWVNMCCSGAGVLAALTGAQLHPESYDDIWFRVQNPKPISELHIKLDPENIWLKRLLRIGKLIQERWGDRVLISMPDIGGVMDVLSSFRPSEMLLLDLYDEPEHVLRVIDEIEVAWNQCYDLFDTTFKPMNPGYCAWAGIYSDVPSYMMQCDFCYMISPDMFDQFVKPTLQRCSEKLARSFYHLDGKGQLPHLQSLLQIPTLNGVQWIPGDGQPSTGQWPDVFDTILTSGKLAQVMGHPSDLLSIMQKTGQHTGLINGTWATDDVEVAQGHLQSIIDSCHTDPAMR